MHVHVVGAGAAGTALLRALHQRGWSVGDVVCRTTERARERVELAGAGTPRAYDDWRAGDPPAPADLLLIAVPDRHIGAVAEQLADFVPDGAGVALHLSGSVPVEALAPLTARGLAVGSLHPLKSFVDPRRDTESLVGTVAALEGDARALALATRVAEDLELRPFTLRPGARAAWHAAATHAANHLVALTDQCLDLMQRAGLDRDTARSALLPLMRGTLANLSHHDPAAALTGPVVRGDVSVVQAHLESLPAVAEDVARAYRALAARALRLAVAERDLPAAAAAGLARLLEEDPA